MKSCHSPFPHNRLTSVSVVSQYHSKLWFCNSRQIRGSEGIFRSGGWQIKDAELVINKLNKPSWWHQTTSQTLRGQTSAPHLQSYFLPAYTGSTPQCYYICMCILGLYIAKWARRKNQVCIWPRKHLPTPLFSPTPSSFKNERWWALVEGPQAY